MGEIVASMELENTGDREVVSQGLRDESTVRHATVDGVALDLVADCGARTLTPRPESPDSPLLKLK